jgi:hypothetical protein
VKNYGTDSISSGQKIAVTFILNSGTPVSDTLRLTNTLYSGRSIDFTFTQGSVDLTSKGIYSFKIYTTYGGDTIALNDTITRSVEMLGRPAVNLGPDKTVQALTYTLDAGSGYQSYLWDNGFTTQTRLISETGSYWVQVFDENQCDNSDTAYIRFKIRDISPDGFVSPVSACLFNPAEPVSLRVMNTGTDTIPSGTAVNVSYLFNGGVRVNEILNLTAELFPGAFVLHTFPETIDLGDPGDYSLEATTVMSGDIRTTNDTTDIMVYRYAKPLIDFGMDDIEYIENYEFQIDAGSFPYYDYVWQDGYTEPVYLVTSSGTYSVIATDSRTACYDGDTVSVFLIYGDVGVTSTTMLQDGCTGDYDNVTVTVQNMGTASIGKDAPIFIACDVNGIRITLDTLVRSTNFATNTTLELELTGTVRITEEGISDVAFYTIFGEDKKSWNDTLRIAFSALPGPVVDFGDTNGDLETGLPHILDAGAGHKSYHWQDGSTNQTFNVTQIGVYSVTVTAQNDCQTSKTVRINMTNGTGPVERSRGELMIYPNPGNGLFRINLDNTDDQKLLLKLFNSQGQIVYESELHTVGLESEFIDIQHLQRGVYHIVIYTQEKTYQGKVIIQ